MCVRVYYCRTYYKAACGFFSICPAVKNTLYIIIGSAATNTLYILQCYSVFIILQDLMSVFITAVPIIKLFVLGPVRNPVLLHRVALCFPWFLSSGNQTQNSRVAGARPNHQPIGLIPTIRGSVFFSSEPRIYSFEEARHTGFPFPCPHIRNVTRDVELLSPPPQTLCPPSPPWKGLNPRPGLALCLLSQTDVAAVTTVTGSAVVHVTLKC